MHMISKYCPAYDGTVAGGTNAKGYAVDKDNAFGVFGSGFSTSDKTELNDDLGQENSAIVFPFTWGCQYGSLRPEKTCKFSETCLCAFLAYVPPLHVGIGTRDI